MNDNSQKLLSKVLVLEHDTVCLETLRQFCDTQGLIGVRASPEHIIKVLASTLDLGAILLSETYAETAEKTLELARHIRANRPEVPVFLRLGTVADTDTRDALKRLASAVYTQADISPLAHAVDQYLFSMLYPESLVTGITELSLNALSHQFPALHTTCSPPYLVRDRIIFGEVFTLIPLESSWFKGYMLLQTEEAGILGLFPAEQDSKTSETTNFRRVNNVLSEITNLIWGAFKNRYISLDDTGSRALAQVPIVINHAHHYISFGSDHPHLCFEYTLSNAEGQAIARFQQWFVFNLNWSPDQFQETQDTMDELVESGELELF